MVKAMDFMLNEVQDDRGITPSLQIIRKDYDKWDKMIIERFPSGKIKLFKMKGGPKEIISLRQSAKFVDMFSTKFKIDPENLLKSTILMKRHLKHLFNIEDSVFNSFYSKRAL